MAVRILNDLPDAAVHRGERHTPVRATSFGDWAPRAAADRPRGNRPLFIAVTAGIHLVAILGFLSVRHVTREEQPATPIVAEIFEAPIDVDDAPPLTSPPLQQVAYALPAPDVVAIELETSTPPVVSSSPAAITAESATPPLIESVEYVRAPAPVYPRESSRRREYGTVVLRVLVDPEGHAAQILIERSSGFDRLDVAAREAVQRALFRPHEVNGVRQAAQVLIPIEFMRRAG